jgi:hypothetical protein
MALTQMQLIQSLGEAMAWLERELNWGVPATELRHLCGRIGELYAAMITNGQMATEVNQRGYDVVSGEGERISVKTTATAGAGPVSFNPRSMSEVDRVIVLRINTDEMQVESLLDSPVADATARLGPEVNGRCMLSLGRLAPRNRPRSEIKAVTEATCLGYTVRELETGSIEVERDGELVIPAKPALRELAQSLGIDVLNSNGNVLTTRQLGSRVIKAAHELQGQRSVPSDDA